MLDERTTDAESTGMDDELESIRRRKMEELKSGGKKEEGKWPVEPVVLTDDEFDGFIGKYPVVVIDCWAPWCGPCRMVAPVVEGLARELTGKVAFGKLNTDENSRVPMRFNISAIPTLLVFKDGKQVDRIVGALPREQLATKIKKHL